MFCFHGYGKNGTSFEPLEPFLGRHYTMYCIDFPYHGQTEWHDEDVFAPSALMDIIHQVDKSKNKQVTIVGYSLGGRISMQLLQMMPTEIEKIILLAPDGLHKNFWYWLGTQTSIGNRFFRKLIDHPKTIFALISTSVKLKLINENVNQMAHYYLDEKAQRLLLYTRWTVMRKFKPDMTLLKDIIIKNNIRVKLLFGKYDHIILSKRSNFLKDISDNVTIEVIEAGHRLLELKYIEEISNFILR